ncbi:MAG: YqhA family protein [Helicobacteraceae bacterium]|nr:YqhA family protein [Helicobacteraceae bacterium]
MVERAFEGLLVNSRFLVMLSVIFSLLGATVLFVVASYDIISATIKAWGYYMGDSSVDLHADGVSTIIGAIDLYLIAVVLLIFSFGLYELFISRIEALESMSLKDADILTIKSLDQLKDKLGKVVLMVLIVSFFQKVLHMNFSTPLEMLYLALAILALGVALYLMNKSAH